MGGPSTTGGGKGSAQSYKPLQTVQMEQKNPYDTHNTGPLGVLAKPRDPMDDNYGSKATGKREEQLDVALHFLHGDCGIWIVAWSGFAVSTLNTVFGIVYMDFTTFQRCFSFLSVFFLVCASFNLVEVVVPSVEPDNVSSRRTTRVDPDIEQYEKFMIKGAEFVNGHVAFRIQVYVAFGLALLCVCCGVFLMPNCGMVAGAIDTDGPALTPEKLALLIGSAFMLFSSLNLASVCKDRFHADTLEDLYHSSELDLAELTATRTLELAHNTLEMRWWFFFCSCVVSLPATIYMLIAFDLDHTHLGFVIPGLVFMMVAVWYLSSSIEGRGPTNKGIAFWPALGVFLIALGLTSYGMAIMLLVWEMKQALCMAILFSVFSVFILAQVWHKLGRADTYLAQIMMYAAPI